LGSFRSAIELHPHARIDVTQSSEQFEVIAVVINGQPRSFPAPLSVARLLEHLALQGKRVALERNGEIIPRGTFATMELQDGDALEIVVAVGGG
jgi:sulfur carrier protein